MSKDAQQGLENVAALMLERQRIESWLATLEARKASTPDHVYQRVRGDYSTRLKAITDQLLARHTTLKTHVDQLQARLSQFEAEAQRFKDVRAESELRMQVGELSVADWNAKARECDEGVAKLSEAQAQARGALAQAREILAMGSGQTNGAAPTSSSTSSPRISRPMNVEDFRAKDNGGPNPPAPHSPTPAAAQLPAARRANAPAERERDERARIPELRRRRPGAQRRQRPEVGIGFDRARDGRCPGSGGNAAQSRQPAHGRQPS